MALSLRVRVTRRGSSRGSSGSSGSSEPSLPVPPSPPRPPILGCGNQGPHAPAPLSAPQDRSPCLKPLHLTSNYLSPPVAPPPLHTAPPRPSPARLREGAPAPGSSSSKPDHGLARPGRRPSPPSARPLLGRAVLRQAQAVLSVEFGPEM